MVSEIVTPRVQAVEPPYPPEIAAQLTKMMPPGRPPLALFRTFVRNLPMTQAMNEWGSYELSRRLSLSMREREIVIDRTCAQCGCEYEWGVHVALFGDRVGLDAAEVASLTVGSSDDDCWTNPRDRLLIRAVDALHTHSDIPDELWTELREDFSEPNLLDLIILCGWYHAISFVARAVRVPLEPGAPTFASLASSR